ncbi:L-lactate dehydrogenase [Cladophialophora immunda]|uniref:L-lactate dehydrogenase n=1 Tax=Cladophialophora immunda TaxID=569365 RepID=A0A0D2B9Y5_9EURO|nr:L-lactate dehydrogenase [Cladophialophora immunda]KIW34412.1 L-lactate dehydrogenase [Cladophialophora immunda]
MAFLKGEVSRSGFSIRHLKPVKVAVIGVGNVGSATAYGLLLSGLAAEIVLVDLNKKKAEGEAMDLSHAVPFSRQTHIRCGQYADCADASIVIITAGLNQKPGQTRMDLVKSNVAIFQELVPQIAHYAPETILLVATNPVDVLTYTTWKLSGFPIHRVIGSGTTLDTARFRFELGQYYNIDPQSVHADIIGEHGDTELPVWSLASISGMPLKDFCQQSSLKYDNDGMQQCFLATKNAAYDIIQRKGWTDKGIATCLVRIVETILRDEDTLLTVSTVRSYPGVGHTAFSVPSKVTRDGAFQTFELRLDAEEEEQLKKSAESISSVISSLDLP